MTAGPPPGNDPIDDWERDPDLRRMSLAFRAELRGEAAAYEALVAKDLARSRRLADVAQQLCSRGDVVEVTTATASFTGTVSLVRGDLASLTTPVGRVDLALGSPMTLQVVERVRRGGQQPRGGPASFRARLAELEADATHVTVGTTLLHGDLEVTIDAVGVDHVVLTGTTGLRYVALAAVTFVLSPNR